VSALHWRRPQVQFDERVNQPAGLCFCALDSSTAAAWSSPTRKRYRSTGRRSTLGARPRRLNRAGRVGAKPGRSEWQLLTASRVATPSRLPERYLLKSSCAIHEHKRLRRRARIGVWRSLNHLCDARGLASFRQISAQLICMINLRYGPRCLLIEPRAQSPQLRLITQSLFRCQEFLWFRPVWARQRAIRWRGTWVGVDWVGVD